MDWLEIHTSLTRLYPLVVDTRGGDPSTVLVTELIFFFFLLNALNHSRAIKDHSSSLSRRGATEYILLFVNLVYIGLVPWVVQCRPIGFGRKLYRNSPCFNNWSFRMKEGINFRKSRKFWGFLSANQVYSLKRASFSRGFHWALIRGVGDPYG